MSDTTGVAERVTISQGTISLPTYPLRGENRNPVFRSQYGVAHIYPYSLLDDIESEPVEKTYRTLELENRYLRVTVLPDLGGRVYSVFDKISSREVFYKNSVVKFSPLAIRGAFFSGGVEFSFPVAHAPTTADAVNWQLRENEDGSASISIGGLEHISRLRWMITLTLFPDRCALAQDVWLYNPYAIPGRYHYWTNASLDANDQTEFIYPLRRVRSYEFAGTASWPSARLDLILNDPGLPGMEGVPMWPATRMLAPVDFRWQKNMLAQVSIFGRNVESDFFGAWQHSVNHGYAHFADHKDVSGMKLWSWGNAGVGVVNQSALTDDGSVYAETQCGAMETQLDFAFLQPGEIRSWREWWLPLRDLGGLTCASAEAGVRLEVDQVDPEGELEMHLSACPVRELNSALVEISVPEKILYSNQVEMSPEAPWSASFRIQAPDLGGNPLRITIRDADGETLLDAVLERDPAGIEPYIEKDQSPPKTSQDSLQLGLRHENFDNREQAIQAYRKAIALSHKNAEAHFRLGLMLLRSADFTGASSRFKSALAEGIPEAGFYLGLLAFLDGKREEARKRWLEVPEDSSLRAAAMLGLGSQDLSMDDPEEALEWFQQAAALRETPDSAPPISAQLMMGIALARAGRLEESRQALNTVLETDPLNHPALYEMAMLDGNAPGALLGRMLQDDPQYFLDLACFYLGAGLPKDALRVLEMVGQTWQYPTVYYLSAWVSRSLGQREAAKAFLEKAAQIEPDLCFPSRLEEVKALQSAILYNPSDSKARYYLGLFYYAHQRFEEGVRLWNQALEGLPSYDVIYRNLGLAAWQRDHDLTKAIEYFESALELNPDNQDLYLHLDELYKTEGLVEKRAALLEKIDALSRMREDLRKRRIMMLVDLGRHEQALNIMQTEKFVPLEMDQSFHNLYVRALMLRAEDHLDAGDMGGAIQAYQEALRFPENLGVGAPTTLHQAHIYYHLGLAFEKQGRYNQALSAWRSAAEEHHEHGTDLYEFVQKALDKLSRYSEIGLMG